MSIARLEVEEVEHEGARLAVALRGELEIATVPALEEALRPPICEDRSCERLTLDLGGLSFIDSSGLAAIVLVSRLCAKHGVVFELLPGRRSVQRLFEFTGLAEALPFRDGGRAGGA
jgi:anti-sigma B factor antagonist